MSTDKKTPETERTPQEQTMRRPVQIAGVTVQPRDASEDAALPPAAAARDVTCAGLLRSMARRGFSVTFTVYMNQWLFSGNPDYDAGNPDYDHIVSL